MEFKVGDRVRLLDPVLVPEGSRAFKAGVRVGSEGTVREVGPTVSREEAAEAQFILPMVTGVMEPPMIAEGDQWLLIEYDGIENASSSPSGLWPVSSSEVERVEVPAEVA